MLFEPPRHEPLCDTAWDPALARHTIESIVQATESAYQPGRWWPMHPRDMDPGDDPSVPFSSLYFGATGVVWALRYLREAGAADTRLAWRDELPALREASRTWLASFGSHDAGAYLMGELPVCMMALGDDPQGELAASLPSLIESTLEHPARELMWGSPGALLACSFLHERTQDAAWAERFRRITAQLRRELHWSDAHRCHYWTQDLYGRQSNYLDAVHGFVATARALSRGRQLLDADAWAFWQQAIVDTVSRTATWDGDLVNWRTQLDESAERPAKWLMQFCHGAPGFVICLADLPNAALDGLLHAAGEAVWAAGPLRKGGGLCHGTAGNGYALLALFARTGDERWLQRARRFAMHAMAQSAAETAAHGPMRFSLWTGDLGLAIYLWDCLRGVPAFPTLDAFWATPPQS